MSVKVRNTSSICGQANKLLAGIIMGFPVTVSMNIGMVVGWAMLSPLSKQLGWAPGLVSSTTDGSRGWIVSNGSK